MDFLKCENTTLHLSSNAEHKVNLLEEVKPTIKQNEDAKPIIAEPKPEQTRFRTVTAETFELKPLEWGGIVRPVNPTNISELNDTECTGCGACYNACPKKCITMESNSEGFLFPVTGDDCVKCGICNKVCPILHKPSENKPLDCFAIAADDETRYHASSGGVFPVAAKKILSNGGYVCGAGWSADFRSVIHKVINNADGLQDLCYSKYLQSDTNTVFAEIKRLLDNNERVLFSGCPCQVAGLRNYLEKDCDSLITMGLICHGVPSPLAWQKWLDSTIPAGSAPIVRVTFRDKRFGWGGQYLLLLLLLDGTEITQRSSEGYLDSFLSNYNLRKCCYDCSFKNKDLTQISDITIGDCWDIGKIDSKLNDKKGISLVLAHTEKGKDFLYSLNFNLIKIITLEQSKQRRMLTSVNLDFNTRNRFYKALPTHTYQKTLEIAKKKKLQVGVVGKYNNNNIGCQLLCLATYKVIENLGYSVKMLRIDGHFDGKPTRGQIWESLCGFTHAIVNKTDGNKRLNKGINAFVTTSDRTFSKNWKEKDDRYTQHWADESKIKISFAASFGGPGGGYSEADYPELKRRLSRFDHLSVREPDCVEFIHKLGIDNVRLLPDNVFSMPRDFYLQLIEVDTRIDEIKREYMLVHLIGGSKDKSLDVVKMLVKPNVKVIFLSYGKNALVEYDIAFGEIVVIKNMCHWLSLIKNAEFVVSDSFHATCFSLIFNVPFISLDRGKMMNSKIENLLAELNMKERNIKKSIQQEKLVEICNQPIDWRTVNNTINIWRGKCLEFIDIALKGV
jgi:coenzyme F420-reducing hydrogenase beta subunit